MTRRHGLIYGIAFMVGVLALGDQSAGQAPAGRAPDLSGIFSGRMCVSPDREVCPELSGTAVDRFLTGRAQAFAAAFDELAAPKYDCAPATLPGLFGDPYAWEIDQQADRVILRYEKDDIVRTVWLDGFGHEPPGVGDFFAHGYSTGRYEDDELVVETRKFAFDPAGLAGDFLSAPSSTQKRIVERYSRDGERLRMRLTVEDPIFLLAPVEYVMQWSLSNQAALSLPWSCNSSAAQRNLRLIPTKYPEDPPVVRSND